MLLTPRNPNLLDVAKQAEEMAKTARENRMAVVFQTVSVVSMALMGVTAATHLIRDMLRSEQGRSRGR